LGRRPLPEELAQQSGLPLRIVAAVEYLPRQPLSLQTPIQPTERSQPRCLEHYIEDRRAGEPADRVLQELVLAAARKQLSILSARQETALRYRFGIGMNTEHTLQEIGDMFVITRERARQIETQALRRLRSAGGEKHRRHSNNRQRRGNRPSRQSPSATPPEITTAS
jgi:RNA polymerase primary sigma factor